MMDPHAWFLKVAIVQIELKQKDPTIGVRSSPPDSIHRSLWHAFRSDTRACSRESNGHRLSLAFEIAALDGMALWIAMVRSEKNDQLREVFARALRSIRQAILHPDVGFEVAKTIVCAVIEHRLHVMRASARRFKHESVDASDSDSELAKFANTFHAFLTSVLHLLTFVFQYLAGYVDRGGSKTFSSGAFDFRVSFVALVLFQGAYVWIKFRQAARPGCRKRKAPDAEHGGVDVETGNLKGVHRRIIKNASGDFVRFKYEPRCQRLPLGEYHTAAEAQIVRQIARYYYGKTGGCVELDDGRFKFPIPSMSEEERGLAGEAKRKWVTSTAKQVGKQMYADFQREMKGMATEAGSHGAEFNDPSSFALPSPCPSLPVLTTGVAEPAAASAAPSSPSVPLLLFDGTIVGDADDSFASLSDFEDMFAELSYAPALPELPDRQSSVVSYQMHHEGLAQLLGDPSLPEVGAISGDTEHNSEPDVNPSSSFQEQRDLVAVVGTEELDGVLLLPQSVPDLQQLLLCQKKCLEENARQFVDLDHQLKAYQIQYPRLQQEKEQMREEKEQMRQEMEQMRHEKEQFRQEKEQLQQENEHLQQGKESLQSAMEQVAKILSCHPWTGIIMEIQQRE